MDKMDLTNFPYLSQTTFLRSPFYDKSFPFAVAGITWDGSVTNRPGARFGPNSIRLSSHMLCDGIHPYFNMSLNGLLCDAGDLPLPNTDLKAMREAVQPLVSQLISKTHVAWLGGDHSITLSLLRAYRAQVGRPLGIVHLDAHCDTWKDHFGEESGHGTWVYEAVKEELVAPECFIQLGIRSGGEKSALEYIKDQGGIIFSARDLTNTNEVYQWKEIVRTIQIRRARNCEPPMYLTLDIDCLDPAYAPGTGTPEPGGLSSRQVITFLECLASIPFIGMDCVEVSPPYDHSDITSLAAAHLVWTYLCGQASRQNIERSDQ